MFRTLFKEDQACKSASMIQMRLGAYVDLNGVNAAGA
jgi:hypothetical protein